MKAIKKRSGWQNLLRVLRNNAGYLRVLSIREIHRKRVLRRFIYEDYDEMNKFLDGDTEKKPRRGKVKPHNGRPTPTLFDTLFPQ